MDLIVHTPGGSVQSVSGVNETTTCAQIVYALAHATCQRGRFSLIAKIAMDTNNPNKEYHFVPNERPFELAQESLQRGIGVEFELRRIGELEGSNLLEHSADREETPNDSSNHSSQNALNDYFDQHTRRCSVDNDKYRLPPPDYNLVMAERCNSLRRGAPLPNKQTLTFLNIPNFSLPHLYTHSFSRPDLEALIEIQENKLTAQKGELIRMELTLLNSNERETVQLWKQHNNLQAVLNSLRNSNWPERIKAESTEAERLHTAIAAMRTALAEKKRELHEAIQLQLTLEKQLTNELMRTETGAE